MTLRNYILLGLAEYVAMVAGILFATHGQEKLLAAAIALAMVGPVWMIGRRSWVRKNSDNTPRVGASTIRPQVSLIISFVGLCSIASILPGYFQRRDWMGLVVFSFMALWFLHGMYLAKQRWNRLKNPEESGRAA